MALKPTEKLAWVSDDGATKIQEPTGSKKLTGFLKNEKPPFNFLNWLFNNINHFINWLAGNTQYNIIIDSDSDEQDYASLAAYIADSPVAGDRVLIKVDEVLSATLSIPAGIEITQLKGKKFTLVTNFSPIIQFGNNVKTKGDFRVENSDTGTIAKGFSVNGDDNNHDNLVIENVSTGTITGGVYIEAGAEGNYSQARSINSGGGAITNDLTDNSGNDENYVIVRGDAGIARSGGVRHTHSDDNDGGSILDPVLVKLKKGADVASASALSLGTDGNYFDITGTTAITSIDTIGIGTIVRLHFDASLILTHNATDLVLPGGNNIITAAGDEATFVEYATGDWRLTSYLAVRPAFSVHKNGSNQTGIVNNTWTKITWSTEKFDTNSNFASDRFTPTVAGKYLLSAAVRFTVGNDQSAFQISISKNGAPPGNSIHEGTAKGSGAGAVETDANAVVDANGSTDFFEIYVWHDTGSDKIADGTAKLTYFTGCKID